MPEYELMVHLLRYSYFFRSFKKQHYHKNVKFEDPEVLELFKEKNLKKHNSNNNFPKNISSDILNLWSCFLEKKLLLLFWRKISLRKVIFAINIYFGIFLEKVYRGAQKTPCLMELLIVSAKLQNSCADL